MFNGKSIKFYSLFVILVFCFSVSAQKTIHKTSPNNNAKLPGEEILIIPPTTKPSLGINWNERSIYLLLQKLANAEGIYRLLYGNGIFGNYGTLEQLRQTGLIDAPTATGERYGYRFSIRLTPVINNYQPRYNVIALPIHYGRTGKSSFYLEWSIRMADKGGEPAAATDQRVLICGAAVDEAINSLNVIYNAELAYKATLGNGRYATRDVLGTLGLIEPMLSYYDDRCSYTYQLYKLDEAPGVTAAFKAIAHPTNFSINPLPSFYVNREGVVRVYKGDLFPL